MVKVAELIRAVSILLDDVVHNTQYYTLTGQLMIRSFIVNAIPYGYKGG